MVIVLCDLEGQTCEEAARRIGRPVGTVKCWRSRGRERLRRRLIRSGLAPSSALGAAYTSDVAQAAEAARALTDGLTAGAFPASVRALVKGVFKAMILSKLKTAAAVICALVFLTTGLGTAVRVAAEDPKKPGDQAQSEPPRPAATKPVPPVTAPLEKFGGRALAAVAPGCDSHWNEQLGGRPRPFVRGQCTCTGSARGKLQGPAQERRLHDPASGGRG